MRTTQPRQYLFALRWAIAVLASATLGAGQDPGATRKAVPPGEQALFQELNSNFGVQFGIRDLLDRVYEYPVALTVDRISQDGRCAFVKLSWTIRE